MTKFQYCSSEDELRWYIDPTTAQYIIELPAHATHNRQHRIRQWIEECCSEPVYVWNLVRTPTNGQAQWGSMISPQGAVRMYFTNKEDHLLGMLKWFA